MIQTVPVDIQLNVITGLLLAGQSSGLLVKPETGPFNRAFLITMGFGIFVFLPIGAYLFIEWADWSLMYFIDPARLAPGWSLGLALLSYQVSLATGFFTGHHLHFHGKITIYWILVAAFVFLFAAFSFFTYDRLLNVGSYEEFHSVGGVEPIIKTRLFFIFIPIFIYFGAPLYFIVSSLKKLSASENIPIDSIIDKTELE